MAPLELRLAQDEAQFGGKSVQLGAALRDGLPVPPGWALSVDFVEALVCGNDEARATLAAFLADKPEPFAVRSSGVGEDAKIASFAGMHFTELNRIGVHDVLDAIRAVWDSGYSAGARAYRAKLGITGTPRVAVTLQRMIFPECAGVMFTRHPVSGADEYVIEASWGLGETIVAGLVIPDHFRFRKDGTLIEKRAGTKDVVFRALPGGGVEETTIDDPQRVSGYCLDDAQLAALVALGARCERHYGPGRDVEWGVQDGVVYLLQCRSITVTANA